MPGPLGYPTKEATAIAVASLSFPLTLFSSTYNAIFAREAADGVCGARQHRAGAHQPGADAAVAFSGGGLIRMLVAYDIGFLANSVVCLYFARKFVRPSFRFDAQLTRGRSCARRCRSGWP